MALRGAFPNPQPTVLTFTPTTGQTVTIPDQSNSMTIYINPAGTLAAVTLALPSDSVSQVGQVIRVFCTQIVTALTLTNILPNLTTLAAVNSGFTIQKIGANSWIRL